MKTLITVVVIVAIIGAIGFGSYVNAYNYGNKTEKQIIYNHKNLQNILAQYYLKVKEVVQVPKMKTADLEKITTAAMTGRYGDNGSGAMMNWITENYPGQVTDELYSQISRLMEAGRNEYKNANTRHNDMLAAYETALGNFWQGMWMSWAGYPSINLADYQTTSSVDAKEAFRTGVETPLQLQ